MKTGIELIAEERQRQVEKEGWTPEHDSEHTDGSLAMAAVTYAIPKAVLDFEGDYTSTRVNRMGFWPWSLNWWKPTPDNRVRELVKAGALIAAEIDRLNTIDQ